MATEDERKWWEAVDPQLREKAVKYLREKLTQEDKIGIRAAIKKDPIDWIIPYHFFWGMYCRNLLREVITDDELPPCEYYAPELISNWDDYYVRAVEEAVSL